MNADLNFAFNVLIAFVCARKKSIGKTLYDKHLLIVIYE